MKLLDRLKLWRRGRRLRRSSIRLRADADDLAKRLDAALRHFTREHEHVVSLFEDLRLQLKQQNRELDDFEREQRRYEDETETLRTKISILEKIAVPGLTQANQMLIERLNAATAVEIRKQVAFKEVE